MPPPPLEPHSAASKAGHTSIAILATAAGIALLYFGRVFFITVVIATIIAFLLDPVVTIFVRLRLPRAVASFIVCAITLLVLYLMGLGAYTEISSFMEDLPTYSQRMNDIVDNVATRADQVEKRTYQIFSAKAISGDAARRARAAGREQEPAQGKQGSRANRADCSSGDSRSANPQRADAPAHLRLRICAVIL